MNLATPDRNSILPVDGICTVTPNEFMAATITQNWLDLSKLLVFTGEFEGTDADDPKELIAPGFPVPPDLECDFS